MRNRVSEVPISTIKIKSTENGFLKKACSHLHKVKCVLNLINLLKYFTRYLMFPKTMPGDVILGLPILLSSD